MSVSRNNNSKLNKNRKIMKERPIVTAYYFPNWHVDPQLEELHGKGWTEWRVSQYATPRFPGHQQPKVPLWGYQDEARPEVMAQKISAAHAYGVDAFLWDWYFLADGPYRHRCLEEGFLKAPNRDKLKFAIMWANHNQVYAHPASYWKPAEPTADGSVNAETFRKCTDYCLEHFLGQPNYLRCFGGKLYFNLYRSHAMSQEVGGADVLAGLIREFRDKVRKAGLGELHIEAMASEIPGYWDALDDPEHDFSRPNAFIRKIGLDGLTNYSWRWDFLRTGFPDVDYQGWAETNRHLPLLSNRYLCVPFNPQVQVGWDPSPRTVQSDMFERKSYPFGSVVLNNTPERFQSMLENALECVNDENVRAEMINISCWNEWTEGAYLEPDTRYGYSYLRAVRDVFGPQETNGIQAE